MPRKGSALQNKKGSATRKVVWMSPSFLAGHADVARVILEVTASCGWRFVATQAAFLEQVAHHAARPTVPVAFVTDLDRDALRGAKMVFSEREARTFFCVADPYASFSGMCGK